MAQRDLTLTCSPNRLRGCLFTTVRESQSCSKYQRKLTLRRFSAIWTWRRSTSECQLISNELKEQEATVCAHGDIDSAERINQEINDLREKEILLKNFIIIDQNQKAVS